MPDLRGRRARRAAAAVLVLLGAVLLVAGAYVPRALFDDAELVATANLVVRGLGFGAVAGAAVLLLSRREQGSDGSPTS